MRAVTSGSHTQEIGRLRCGTQAPTPNINQRLTLSPGSAIGAGPRAITQLISFIHGNSSVLRQLSQLRPNMNQIREQQ
jgi:hypothetical protein